MDVIANLNLSPNQLQYNFNYNLQHDAADILRYKFSDLTGVSSLTKESVETKLQVTHANKCFRSVATAETYSILTVSLAPTVGEAIDMHIADEYL